MEMNSDNIDEQFISTDNGNSLFEVGIVDNEDESIDVEGVDEEVADNQLTAYDIAVFYNTYNLSTLMKWWGTKLIVPEFQRAFVWKKKKSSEFVDSVLRGLPVPSIFFYDDTDNNRMLVVDGQQRLKSLYSYIKEEEFHGKKFRLIGNIHPKWKGKSYSELDQEDRDRLDDTLLNITVMRQLAPDDGQSSMYLAFQRINTGGEILNAQEIRMAVSYGKLAKIIYEIANDKRFDKWEFLKTNEQRENNNNSIIQELVLKFLTYYLCYPNYEGTSTRTALDKFFSTQKDLDETNPKKRKPDVTYYSEDEIRNTINAAFEELNSLDSMDFAPYTRPARILMEAIWVGLTYRKLKLGKDIPIDNLKQYIRGWKEAIGEEKYSKLFQTRRTTSMSETKTRIEEAIKYFSGDF